MVSEKENRIHLKIKNSGSRSSEFREKEYGFREREQDPFKGSRSRKGRLTKKLKYLKGFVLKKKNENNQNKS